MLPVCINDDDDIADLTSALDLYRVMRKKGKNFPAFDAVLNALDYADNPNDSPCLDIDAGGSLGSCYRMDTTTEIMDFYPNNPFNPSDDSKTAVGMSWVRLDDIINDNSPDWLQSAIETFGERVGYFPNDCFIQYDTTLNPFQQWSNFYDALRGQTLQPFPTVTINFEGSGQVEIEFPQVPLGGGVLVFWDFNPELDDIIDIITGAPNTLDNVQFLELSRDIIGIPPELIPTVIFEHDFQEDTTHSIKCVFTPAIQPDQAPFIFPFAGIREVEFCGNLKAIGAETNTVYDQYNHKLSQALRSGYIMGTTDDFYDALIRWTNERANRWLFSSDPSNIVSGIEVDPDTGIVTVKDSTIGSGEVIDAAAQEIHYGGVYNQAVQFKKLFEDLNTNIDSGYSANTLINLTRVIINPADLLAWDALITDYRTNDPEIVIDATALSLELFCKDVSSAVLAYASANHATTELELNTVIDFVAEIPAQTWKKWYNEGQSSPRLGYETASCYRQPSLIGELNYDQYVSLAAGVITFPQNTLANRKWRLTVSGLLVDDNGKEYDGVFFKDGTTITRSQLRMGASGDMPEAENQPLYSDDHKYNLDFEVTGIASRTRYITAYTPTSGKLTFRLYDNGAL